MGNSAEPNKIYIVGKVLMRATQKCNFYWIWATVSKVKGIYVKFTKTTHQIWSCHVTLASNSEKFYHSPNSVLNFRLNFCRVSHEKSSSASFLPLPKWPLRFSWTKPLVLSPTLTELLSASRTREGGTKAPLSSFFIRECWRRRRRNVLWSWWKLLVWSIIVAREKFPVLELCPVHVCGTEGIDVHAL